MPDVFDDETLADLAFFALDHAVDSVAASGGPLVPFLMVDRDGERSLTRFVAETLEEGLDAARARAAAQSDAYVAVAFDGYLTDHQGRFDAVYVETAAPTGDRATLAQRYRFEGPDGGTATPFGNPTLVR